MKITDVNVETGEIVVRDATEDELLQYEKDSAERQAQIKKMADAQKARNALFEKLGITEEEAKLLLS